MTRRNKIIRQILLSISSGMLIAFIVASSFVLIRHTAIYPQIHLSINQLFSGNDLRPSPHYSFKMVVDIQMEALMNQNKANWQNFVRHNEAEVKIKNYQGGGSGDLVPVQNYSSYEIKKTKIWISGSTPRSHCDDGPGTRTYQKLRGDKQS